MLVVMLMQEVRQQMAAQHEGLLNQPKENICLSAEQLAKFSVHVAVNACQISALSISICIMGPCRVKGCTFTSASKRGGLNTVQETALISGRRMHRWQRPCT